MALALRFDWPHVTPRDPDAAVRRRPEALRPRAAARRKSARRAREEGGSRLWNGRGASAHRLECEKWNARLFLGGEDAPSPTILAAIDARASLLEVQCAACRTTRRIDLSQVIWPRKYQVHTLRPKLFCEPCCVTTGRKVRPLLVGLFDPHPEPEIPARAVRRV
jgi:hypothetical protein